MRSSRVSAACLFVAVLLAGSAGIAAPRSEQPAASDIPPPSTFIGTAAIEESGSVATASDGDLWPSCWSDDGALYTANGDGKGFSLDGPFADIVVNRVDGTPPDLHR